MSKKPKTKTATIYAKPTDVIDVTMFGDTTKRWLLPNGTMVVGSSPALGIYDEWPQSADEIIDRFAKELAEKRK